MAKRRILLESIPLIANVSTSVVKTMPSCCILASQTLMFAVLMFPHTNSASAKSYISSWMVLAACERR